MLLPQALIKANAIRKNQPDQNTGYIYDYTVGVLFIGTPHRGYEDPSMCFGHMVLNAAKAISGRSKNKVLKILKMDSDVLDNQRRNFAIISESMTLACLFEEKPTKDIGVVSDVRLIILIVVLMALRSYAKSPRR